jgi:rare lipoprotein A
MSHICIFTLLAVSVAGCSTMNATQSRGHDKHTRPATQPPATHQTTTDDVVPQSDERRAEGPNKPYVVSGKRYVPDLRDRPFTEEGLASYYGNQFQGKRTASGEPYNKDAMTAAHKTLPIPSYVRVTNIQNGHSVIVRINDRGPFHSRRIIDLSYAAAQKLDIVKAGQQAVKVERLPPDEVRRLNVH